MAESHPGEGSRLSNDATAEGAESNVELNVKTLDSRIFSFFVDKNIQVSVFKDKIASKIGVPVEQQRLIFRGRVLKDSHLLSEYHLENGHTLHLVGRQPSQAQTSSSANSGETTTNTGNGGQDANAGVPRARVGHLSHSVVLGPVSLREQGDSIPDLNQVIRAVFSSFGIWNTTAANVSGSIQPTMPVNPPLQSPQGNEAEGRQGTTGNQGSPFGQAFPSQSLPQVVQIPFGASIPLPSLNQPIPGSLHTLSEFMNNMEQFLTWNGNQPNQSSSESYAGNQPNQSSNETRNLPPVELPANSLGVPTPEALAIVLRHAQRLLSDHAINSLSQTAGRIEQEGGSAVTSVRHQIQTESQQVGLVMLHLGSLFLELGRTMLTLHMGQSSAESYVNAGPAVYISSSGPNPIMVQPFPLQTSSPFGGSVPPLNHGNFVPGGVGTIPTPRQVNIHIHTAVDSRSANGEGMQGDRGNGTGPGDSGQTRVRPARNIGAAGVPSRPNVISVSGVASRDGSSQPLPTSVPLSSVMAELSSQIRSFADNMHSENQGSSAHPEGSVTQNMPAVSDTGIGDGHNVTSLPNSIGELSLPSTGSVSDTESVLAQAANITCNKEDTKGVVNRDAPSSSTLEGFDTPSIGGTLQTPVDDMVSASRSNQGADNPEAVMAVPLGLGMGGLQPKRRSRQSDLQGAGGDGIPSNSPTNQNQHMTTQRLTDRRNSSTSTGRLRPVARGVENIQMEGVDASDQIDPANVMSQVLNSPALDGLLAGVSQQTGFGSPDVLRNMLGQLTQNPAMMNTVNQIAQQIASQDFGSMFAGSGRSGGFDLSTMIQQMIPMVSQALGSASTNSHHAPTAERELHPPYTEMRASRDEESSGQNLQIDLHQVVQRIKCGDPPEDILRSVVESVTSSHGYWSEAETLVNELCAEDGLASGFMEMLHRDVSQRVGDENGSAGKP